MKIAKTIYITRHGATHFNNKDLIQGWTDNPLSPKGITQSEHLAERMKTKELDVIYHSPLSRARDTAEIVNRFHNTELKTIDSFIEMNLGDWEGQNFHQVVREHPDIYQQWATMIEKPIPGGESFMEVYLRVKAGVETVLNSSYQNILISAHAMVNRAIMGNIMSMDANIARKFRMENCAYSKLIVYQLASTKNIVVDTWNDVSHL
jgi:broad specificity phosphatase PhoE